MKRLLRKMMHAKRDIRKIVQITGFATRGIFALVFAASLAVAPAAYAFEWYGPGSGIDYTGFVYGQQGIGFSWPWTFVGGNAGYGYNGYGYSGYGGYGSGYNAQPPQWQQVPQQSVTAGNVLQFTVSAYNNYGGAITYTASNLPSGASFNSATRTFTWMPTASQRGNVTVTFRATDRVGSADMTVTITVNAPPVTPAYNPYSYGGGAYYGYGQQSQNQYSIYYNQQPQISPLNSTPVMYPIREQWVRVGETIRFQVQAYDREGDFLRYSSVGEPQGAFFDTNTRTFTWTPTPLQIGKYVVNFRVSQSSQMYAEASAVINVLDQYGQLPYTTCSAGPGPYLFGFSPSSTVREGDLFSYQIIAGSGNGNQASYRIVDGPIGLTVDARTGYMRWVPSFNQSGTYPVRIAVYNGQCETVQTFTITVQDVR